MLDRYGVRSSVMRAMPSYIVNEAEETVTVNNVDRDLTITLNFHRTSFVVTVIERYADGSQAEEITEYVVKRGEDFFATFTLPDEYLVEVESDPPGFLVDYYDNTLSYEDVDQDMYIILTYHIES